MDPSAPSDLDALLVAVLDALEEGASVDEAVSRVCAERPETAADLRRRLSLLGDLGVLGSGGATSAAEVPERLGRFRLLRRLGGGGMGVVHLAVDEDLGREVALKLVRPEHLYFGGARERFRREVETVARLAHPNIVPVHAVGEEAGVPYFAMERVRGCSLGDVLKALQGGRPDRLSGADMAAVVAAHVGDPPEADEHHWLFAGSWEDTCLRILRQVAGALDHAHRQGVLHRDIKPSNIMLASGAGDACRALLVDFGLASSAAAGSLTASGARLGSLPYMAPEQVRGEVRSLDARCDVYGLGVTLYELLTLQPAFAAPSDPELVMAIQGGAHRAPRELNPALSWEAETVCLTAIDSDPQRRYASMADLARDLDNVLQRRPVEARRAGPWLRARRWVQRHPTRSVAAMAAALLLLGGPSLYAWQQREANVALGARNATITEQNAELERSNARIREQADALRGSNEQIRAQAAALEESRDRIQAQADALQDRNATIGAQNLELEASNTRIRAQAEAMERRYELAYTAINTLLARVGETGLEGIPQVTAVRRALYADARRFLQLLVDEGGDDVRPRLGLARLLQLDGELLSRTGDVQAAQDAMARSIQLLGELAREFPDDPTYLTDTALGLRKLAVQLLDRGRQDQAIAMTAEAVALQERVVERFADPDGFHGAQLVITLNNLGGLRFGAGELVGAADAFDRAVERATDLTERFPGDPRHPTVLAQSLAGAGGVAARRGRDERARQLLEQALPIYERCLSLFPGHPEVRQGTLDATDSLAQLILDEAEPSRRLFERASELAEGLTRDFPDEPGHQMRWARIVLNRALWAERHGDPALVERFLQEAAVRQGVVVERFPDSAAHRLAAARGALQHAEWLLGQGRDEEAAARVERAVGWLETLVAEGTTNGDPAAELERARGLARRAAAAAP